MGVGVTKIQYIGGDCLKRRTWIVCRFKGGFDKKEGSVFEGGLIPSAHYGADV